MGALVLVVAINGVAVDVILSGNGTGTATTDLRKDCVIMHPPVLLMHPHLLSISPFYPDDGYILFCCLLLYALTK